MLRQFDAPRPGAAEEMDAICDGDGNGGGIVPYRLSRPATSTTRCNGRSGLELFLLIDDPWRVFFTTDHPNGAPFTAYPEILALLMDANVRGRVDGAAADEARWR